MTNLNRHKAVQQHLCEYIRMEYMEHLRVISLELDHAISQCKALDNAKIDSAIEYKNLQRALKRASEQAEVYVENVYEFYQYGNDEVRYKRIREKLQSGDKTEMADYISQLQKRLVSCEESYHAVQEAISEVIKASQQAASFCEKKCVEADANKYGTMKTGAVIAGGVILGALAGIFTFGLGTFTTLAAVSTCTAIGGGGIYAAVRYYEKCKSSFTDVERAFNSVQSQATKVEDWINKHKTKLKIIANTIDNTSMNTSDTVSAFDWLYERISESKIACTMAGRSEVMKQCT